MLRDTGSTPPPRVHSRDEPDELGRTDSDKRIIGYDIARALAVFGMVVVNFKIVMSATQDGPDWLVGLVGLLDGRAAATFVVLAGVGISMLSRRARLAGDRVRLARDRNTLLRRALFLFVVGLLYTPIWPADILHFYGVYIAVAAFLLPASSRRLWVISGVLVLLFAVLLFALNYEQGWDWETLEYDGLWTRAGMIRHLFFNGFHPTVPWLAFLLVGMAVGRLDMGDPAVRRRVFVWGAGVALIAENTSGFLVRTLSEGVGREERELIAAILGAAPMPPMPLYMLAGAGTAIAIIAAAVALGERCEGVLWIRPLVATGQLALTLYVSHVALGMGLLQALGTLEHQTLPFALAAAAAFCLAGAAFASFWRSRFQRGPLEAVMRILTDPRSR